MLIERRMSQNPNSGAEIATVATIASLGRVVTDFEAVSHYYEYIRSCSKLLSSDLSIKGSLEYHSC